MFYNVTVSLDPSVESDWVTWMQTTHIPDVMKTGHFIRCYLSKVIGNEVGECTFSVLYLAKSKNDFEQYIAHHAPRLQQEHTARYEGKFVAFRTNMELLTEFKQ